MRKTEVFGIDIPELGDPSDITVVSDAIHDVENAMGCKIEFMNAVSTPGLISLNSKVRIHPYTTYYDDMVFAFIAPVDIPVGNSIAIKIDDLPQQPFNNEAFNGKGSLVFITYNAKTGFKSYENGSKIINDLTTGGANDALSAEMGKQLQNSKLDKTDAWRIQPKALPSGTDLNSIIEPGFYASTSSANIIHNKPNSAAGAFELTVTAIYYGDYATQLLKDFTNNNYYTRRYDTYGGSATWTQWQKIALEDEVVKKSGDTMTGSLSISTSAWSTINFNDASNSRIGTIGANVNEKTAYFVGLDNTRGVFINSNGDVKIPCNNLQTAQNEVIDAINNSVSDKGLIKNKQPAYFDTLTTPGHYCLSECEIYKGAYKWGNFVVYKNRDFVTQIYYPDNAKSSIISRTLYGPRGWQPWRVAGGQPIHVAGLLNVGDSYVIPGDIFLVRIDLFEAGGKISASTFLDNTTIGWMHGIAIWGQNLEIEIDIDQANRTLRLSYKGEQGDGYANVYAMA